MNNELYHHGILGMRWGVRRYQNADGSYTQEGLKRYRQSEAKYYKAAQQYKDAEAGGNRAEMSAKRGMVKAAQRRLSEDYDHLKIDRMMDREKANGNPDIDNDPDAVRLSLVKSERERNRKTLKKAIAAVSAAAGISIAGATAMAALTLHDVDIKEELNKVGRIATSAIGNVIFELTHPWKKLDGGARYRQTY